MCFYKFYNQIIDMDNILIRPCSVYFNFIQSKVIVTLSYDNTFTIFDYYYVLHINIIACDWSSSGNLMFNLET